MNFFDYMEDEKDEIQLEKAKFKVEAANDLITKYIKLNDKLSPKERKQYSIILDYITHNTHSYFTVKIKRTYKPEVDPLFQVYFSLKDLDSGLKLLDQVRDNFVEQSELIYTGFSREPYYSEQSGGVSSFDAIGANGISLYYSIHSENEYKNQIEFENSLYAKENSKIKIKKPSNC